MKNKESWLVLVVTTILTLCHPSTPHVLPSLPWGFDPMYLQSVEGSDPDLSPKDGPFWPLVSKWNLPMLVREGRADNFIRFGRTMQHDQQEFPEHEGSNQNPIDWSVLSNRGLDHRSFGGVTLSRASKSYKKKNNFIRLGRENPRTNNFIRLGRSGGNQEESLRHWNIVGSPTVNGSGRVKETDAINGAGSESHENVDYSSIPSAVN